MQIQNALLKRNHAKWNHVKRDLPVLPSSIQTMGSSYKSHTRNAFYWNTLITVENNWEVHEIMDHTLWWWYTCLLGTLRTCNILSLFSVNKVLPLSRKNLTNGKTQYTDMLIMILQSLKGLESTLCPSFNCATNYRPCCHSLNIPWGAKFWEIYDSKTWVDNRLCSCFTFPQK